MALSPEVINALRAEVTQLRGCIASIDKNVAKLQEERGDALRQIDLIEKFTAELKGDIKADVKVDAKADVKVADIKVADVKAADVKAADVKADVKAEVKANEERPLLTPPSPAPVSSVESAKAAPPQPVSLKDKLQRPMKSSVWAL
jgi:hypothetical protein